MIIGYSLTDYGLPGAVANWEIDTIRFFKSARDPTLDNVQLHAWIRGTPPNGPGDAAAPANSSFRHYVPYNVILDHIKTTLKEKTRKDIADILAKWIPALNITVDPVWNNIKLNRAYFDTGVEWAIESICDLKENIYFGPGKGDGAGTQIDVPTGTMAVAQTIRLEKARKLLNKVLGANF